MQDLCCGADPAWHGTRTGTFIVLNLAERTILIGGMRHAGELMKAMFTVVIDIPAEGPDTPAPWSSSWTGGPHGVGSRMTPPCTRAMVRAALDGRLADAPMVTDPIFGLARPTHLDGVPGHVPDPRGTWSDPAAVRRDARRTAVRAPRAAPARAPARALRGP